MRIAEFEELAPRMVARNLGNLRNLCNPCFHHYRF